jgi:hypothetical protein
MTRGGQTRPPAVAQWCCWTRKRHRQPKHSSPASTIANKAQARGKSQLQSVTKKTRRKSQPQGVWARLRRKLEEGAEWAHCDAGANLKVLELAVDTSTAAGRAFFGISRCSRLSRPMCAASAR